MCGVAIFDCERRLILRGRNVGQGVAQRTIAKEVATHVERGARRTAQRRRAAMREPQPRRRELESGEDWPTKRWRTDRTRSKPVLQPSVRAFGILLVFAP